MKLKLNFKKLILTIISIILLFANFSFVFAATEEPTLTSEAGILIDSKTRKNFIWKK